MNVTAYTEGDGFALTLDYPNRRFILAPIKAGECAVIYTSYRELADLKAQIEERLKLFDEKQSNSKNSITQEKSNP